MASLVVNWIKDLEEVEGNKAARKDGEADEAYFLRVSPLCACNSR